MPVRAFATDAPGKPFKPFTYDLPPLGPEDVDVAVEHCGVCHSDLSMANNDWGMTAYPFVPGHEVVGTVAAVGDRVPALTKAVKPGTRVGLGWYSRSCMSCRTCLGGDHNMCHANEQTIVGRHGGFADRVRAHFAWCTPVPQGIDARDAGPLFCGGITVFNPIVQFGVRPTDRVGVIGIGGLGHLALQFLRAWGCHVTAFSSTDAKAAEAKSMGAHDVVNSRDAKALERIAGSLDFVLSTVNVDLDWPTYLNTLGPRGRLHTVGVVPAPIPASAFQMIVAQRSISGSPLGSPATTLDMLEFCARHAIKPITEHFPLARVNDALAHLHQGKARYRVVLDVA